MRSSDTRELVLAAPIVKGSRGRNGVFTATRVELVSERFDAGEHQSYVSLQAWSLRTADNAPAQIALSLEDAVVLAEQIQAAVQAVLPRQDCPDCEGTGHVLPEHRDPPYSGDAPLCETCDGKGTRNAATPA